MLMIFDWELWDCETNTMIKFDEFGCFSLSDAQLKADNLVPADLQEADWEKEDGQFIKRNDKHKFIIKKAPSRAI
jgi:hypothetical protein